MAPRGYWARPASQVQPSEELSLGSPQLFLWDRNLRFRCTLLGKNEKLPKVTDVPLRTETGFASVSGVSLVGVTPFLFLLALSIWCLSFSTPESAGRA